MAVLLYVPLTQITSHIETHLGAGAVHLFIWGNTEMRVHGANIPAGCVQASLQHLRDQWYEVTITLVDPRPLVPNPPIPPPPAPANEEDTTIDISSDEDDDNVIFSPSTPSMEDDGNSIIYISSDEDEENGTTTSSSTGNPLDGLSYEFPAGLLDNEDEEMRVLDAAELLALLES